jgi:SAM-dependent methyltransferase
VVELISKEKSGMGKTNYLSYSDLAWTEPILAPPENYVEENRFFCEILNEYSQMEIKSLLHLACGAGCQDYTFKQYFSVTGLDISPQMLALAKSINPEVSYIEGDMRTARLNRQFDAVVIPDSIDYMQTENDLRLTIATAYEHLRTGGVLLIVANTKEEFQENNFIYTAKKDQLTITVFENNFIPDPQLDRYEATIVYLIRKNGKQKVVSETHQLGLFALDLWMNLLTETGFSGIKRSKLEQLYDRYMPETGRYHLTTFLCRKE